MIQQAPDSLDAIRERIRHMTDAELIDYGRCPILVQLYPEFYPKRVERWG
jgi:hypothetical protein